MTHAISRRHFLAATGAAAVLSGARPQRAAADTQAASRPPVVVFSKHLQHLDYPELARTCKRIGLDGVDLTVRGGGHVEPERVAEDLPRAVAALREEGLSVPMITTNMRSGDDPNLRPILEAASELGIAYFRIGGHRYNLDAYPLDELEQVAVDLKGLATVAAEYGMTAGYHNHSGRRYVGAPLWDLFRLFEEIGAPNLGSNFDVGHATVEGAYGDWEITARLLAPHVKMVAVKDFTWFRDRPRWGQLGTGFVQTAEFLKVFRPAGFAGPVSLHFEYRTRDNDELLEHIAEAAVHVRECLDEAGYA